MGEGERDQIYFTSIEYIEMSTSNDSYFAEPAKPPSGSTTDFLIFVKCYEPKALHFKTPHLLDGLASFFLIS
jgi:hypothetical protein